MKLHLVGGFLGSGKTTAILEAARLLVDRGQRVGIITNEQGKHLVDTNFFRTSGMPALEVTGGCVCCHLDDFSDRIEEITDKFNPEVLFAESVGSCADLVATVVKPLVDFRKSSAQPASLTVFCDSRLLLRYLRKQELPFSDSVIYIFEKQIEETNLLIANKIDLLSENDAKDLMFLAVQKFPHKKILPQNSLDKLQVDDWLTSIQANNYSLPLASLDINYDIYAQGEGKFAWADRDFQIIFSDTSQINLIANWVSLIAQMLKDQKIKIGHLKFLITDGENNIRFNLNILDDLEEKLSSLTLDLNQIQNKDLNLLINAMVEGNAALVESILNEVVLKIKSVKGISLRERANFSRTPDYPKPTIRVD
jgi:Ni2+-binding GTPase involved in maturation of urease and hydrogenase